MTRRLPRRLPHFLAAVLAVLLLTLVFGVWARVARPTDRHLDRSANVRRVEWSGALAADGSLAVEVRYEFLPAAVEQLRQQGSPRSGTVQAGFDLPPGAARVRVQGEPATTRQGGRTVAMPVRRDVTVAYELPRTARRFDGDVLLDVATVPSLAQMSNDYGYTEVRGTLTVASGSGTAGALRLPGLRQARADRAGPVLAFAGRLSTYDGAAMVALMPNKAAPQAPSATGAARSRFAAAADARSEGRVPDGEIEHRGPRALVAAVVVTLEVVALAAWAWRVRRLHRRRLAKAAGLAPAERSEPPLGLAPDVMAMLTAPSTRTVASREAVAADLLNLVDRGTIHLDSLDSRRFLLRIPAGVAGSTATERLILQELRPQGQAGAPVTLEGPPLWGPRDQSWLRAAERDIRNRARATGLVANAVKPLALVPALFAAPITAMSASDSDPRLVAPSILALFAAFALWLVLALTAPLDLTDAGLAARSEGLAYACYLRATGGLEDLGAPAVLARGPHLVYGVAVGAAPVAARDVGVGLVTPVSDGHAGARSA